MRDWVKYDSTYPKVLIDVDLERFKEILLDDLYKLDGIV
jgi:hypothetical protein